MRSQSYWLRGVGGQLSVLSSVAHPIGRRLPLARTDRRQLINVAYHEADVLTDEASIDRGVKPLLFVGDILHAIAMSDIDEIEGGGRDEILQACRRPNVGFQVRQQRVSLGSWSHTPSAIAV